MKNFKSAQYQYDNMSHEDEKMMCPICDLYMTEIMEVVQCEYCGWEREEDNDED